MGPLIWVEHAVVYKHWLKVNKAKLCTYTVLHSLNLCVQEVTKKCNLIQNVMEFIHDLVQLIKFSPKQLFAFESLRKDAAIGSGDSTPLRISCPTRWTVRHCYKQHLTELWDFTENTGHCCRRTWWISCQDTWSVHENGVIWNISWPQTCPQDFLCCWTVHCEPTSKEYNSPGSELLCCATGITFEDTSDWITLQSLLWANSHAVIFANWSNHVTTRCPKDWMRREAAPIVTPAPRTSKDTNTLTCLS